MNMISLTNFDSFDKPAGYFPDAEPADPAEDFSSILSNITVMMQAAGLPVEPVKSEPPTGDFKLSCDGSIKQNSSFINYAAGVKMPELPAADIKAAPTAESSTQTPTDAALWA